MSNKPLNEWSKEELVSYLFCGWISPPINQMSGVDKQLAVERYMRTYIRSLTIGELTDLIEWTDGHNSLPAWAEYVIGKAAKGYDAFMAKRGKVAV